MTRRHLALLALCVAALPAMARAAPPAWVVRSNRAAAYPDAKYLTAVGEAHVERGHADDAREHARNEAAGQVAAFIHTTIDQTIRSEESAGRSGEHAEVSAVTHAVAEAQVTGLTYELVEDGDKVYALALLERTGAAAAHWQQFDKLVAEAHARIGDAVQAETDHRLADAQRGYLTASLTLRDAESEEAIARAIAPDASHADAEDPAHLLRNVQSRLENVLRQPPASLPELVASFAWQLQRQGVTRDAQLTVEPLTVEASGFPSAFGKRVASDLELALAKPALRDATDPPALKGRYTITGAHAEKDGQVRVTLVVHAAGAGQAVASAEATLPRSAIDPSLELRPANYQAAREDEEVLGAAPVVSGDLRLEVWTQRGRGPLILNHGEQVKVFLRVNRPAWVRLVYFLADAARTKVVLAQGYYIDGAKVNMAVEYPQTFVVTAPFGVEQLHAVAFTTQPEALPTHHVRMGDGEYDVVEDRTAVVAHRGLSSKPGAPQTAEALLSMTTLP